MPHAMALPTCGTVCSVARANMKAKGKQSPSSVGFGSRRKEPLWRCVEGCGACCKLDKGPSFPTPEEIFTDPRDIELGRGDLKPGRWKRKKVSVELQGSQQEGLNYLVGRTGEFWPRAKGNGRFEIVNAFLELYRSLMGPDGWCINFDKGNRTCSIYNDRPYFCRVEPEVFQSLFGIKKKKFNKEACSFCRDIIKEIYGSQSKELDNFNLSIKSSGFS